MRRAPAAFLPRIQPSGTVQLGPVPGPGKTTRPRALCTRGRNELAALNDQPRVGRVATAPKKGQSTPWAVATSPARRWSLTKQPTFTLISPFSLAFVTRSTSFVHTLHRLYHGAGPRDNRDGPRGWRGVPALAQPNAVIFVLRCNEQGGAPT